jgi:hypothetical protein
MRTALIILIISITCAGSAPAQVIQYEIDLDFNPQQLFFNGAVSDILYTSTNHGNVWQHFSLKWFVVGKWKLGLSKML